MKNFKFQSRPKTKVHSSMANIKVKSSNFHQSFSSELIKVSPKQPKKSHGFKIVLSYQNLPLLTFGRKVESLWNLVGNNSNVFQGLLANRNFGDSELGQSSKFYGQDQS